MARIIIAIMRRNSIKIWRTNFWSSIIGRLITAIYAVFFSYIVYYFMASKQLNSSFLLYAKTSNYLEYIIVGYGFFAIVVSVLMAVGRFFMEEIRGGTIDIILLSPASRGALLFGCGLEQLFRSLLEILVIYILCSFLGILSFHISYKELLCLIVIIFISLFSIGVFVSYIMLCFKDTYFTQNTIFILINLLCGISYPVEYLPELLRKFSDFLPFTILLQLIRSILIENKSLVMHCESIERIMLSSTLYLISGTILLKNYEIKHGDRFNA